MRRYSSAGLDETITFRGHANVLGLHRNTIEVTKDLEISTRADCIIGVKASKACKDLIAPLRRHIQSGGRLRFEIIVDEEKFEFLGEGSSSLDLTHDRELVLRRSDFASERTGAVRCNVAAIDIPRSIIRKLQNPSSNGTLKIMAFSDEQENSSFPPSLATESSSVLQK